MDVTSDRTKADITYSKCATTDTPLSEYLSCIVLVIPFQQPHTKGVAVRMLMLRLETKSQNWTSLRILLCKQLPNTLQHWRSHTLQFLPLLFQQYRLVLKNHFKNRHCFIQVDICLLNIPLNQADCAKGLLDQAIVQTLIRVQFPDLSTQFH